MKSILCIASYEKGFEFMKECKAQGWQVLLVTGESLKNAPWPQEAIDHIFFVPDPDKEWNIRHLIHAVSYLARSIRIDRIVALDDFDVEKAATLREHLRVPGMGETTARNFRDKLAMRVRAQDAGIPIPRFIGIFNYDDIRAFMQSVPAPYVLKPRLQANAIGISKIHDAEQLWRKLDELGDEQSYFLLEEFVPGDICHVDSIVRSHKVLFASCSQYLTTPMEVFHGGHVFASRTVLRGSDLEASLLEINAQVMRGLNLVQGVSHSEFIVPASGNPLFLETSARVGGANIADMVEAATGVNLWREWAKIELAEDIRKYKVPPSKKRYAGLMATLARQEWPDMSSYNDPEVVWKMKKRQHAGLVLQSSSHDRVTELLESYTQRFYEDFFARIPAATKASQLG